MDNETFKCCPKCSQQVVVPDIYWSGGDRPHARRICQCRAHDGCPPNPEMGNHEVARKIDVLEKWVDILLHLVPHGYSNGHSAGSPVSVAPYSGKDLNSDCGWYPAKRPPEMFLEMVAACSEAGMSQSAVHPEKIIRSDLCLYCGSTWNHEILPLEVTLKSRPNFRVRNMLTCYRCDEVKKTNPDVFEWMTSILASVYRISGYSPPPPTPLRPRNILVEADPSPP